MAVGALTAPSPTGHTERSRAIRGSGSKNVGTVGALCTLAAGVVLVGYALAAPSGGPSVPVRTAHRAVPPILIPPAASTGGQAASPAPSDPLSGMVNYTVPPSQGPGGPVFADVGPSRVATAIVPSVPVYATPSAPTPWEHIPNPDQLGATVVFRVTGAVAGWWQIYLPQRPNEASGWVPTADVAVTTDPYHIIVSLGQRLLTLYRNGQAVFQTPIAPGAPSSPTPTGSFFVAFMVRLTDPGNVYGPYAFGTSAFSDTYFSFEGGPGQIGIHGTNQPWVIGSYASHGCIRLPNAAITTVAQEIVPGTAVDIGA